MTAPAPLAMWRIARPETGAAAVLTCAAISPAVALPNLPMTARTTAGVTDWGVARPFLETRDAPPPPSTLLDAERRRVRLDARGAAGVLPLAARPLPRFTGSARATSVRASPKRLTASASSALSSAAIRGGRARQHRRFADQRRVLRREAAPAWYRDAGMRSPHAGVLLLSVS